MQPKHNNLVFCLMGPTAAGKTALALALTQEFPCTIISVDSGMVYRGLDIGSAKPTASELAIAPHRLIDLCDPTEAYSAGQFRVDALREISQVISEGKIPLLVGGTMLYFKALQTGLANLPQANLAVRAQLTQQLATEGLRALYQRLQALDPQTALHLAATDRQRIIRALEVLSITGRSLYELQHGNSPELPPYTFINLILAPTERSLLHSRINERFDQMLSSGLLAEVQALHNRGDLSADLPALRMVGYRQVWSYLLGQLTYQEMVTQAQTATRQLAKRQLTWLRNWPHAQWFDSVSPKVLSEVATVIAGQLKT